MLRITLFDCVAPAAVPETNPIPAAERNRPHGDSTVVSFSPCLCEIFETRSLCSCDTASLVKSALREDYWTDLLTGFLRPRISIDINIYAYSEVTEDVFSHQSDKSTTVIGV